MTKDDILTTNDEAGKEGEMFEWKASLKADGSRDYWLEAKDVSERHFKVSYIEDAREMLAAYQDFVDNQLPIINEKSREFGSQLNYFQRTRNFYKTFMKSTMYSRLTHQEQKQIQKCNMEMDTAAIVKSTEQRMLELAQANNNPNPNKRPHNSSR